MNWSFEIAIEEEATTTVPVATAKSPQGQTQKFERLFD